MLSLVSAQSSVALADESQRIASATDTTHNSAIGLEKPVYTSSPIVA